MASAAAGDAHDARLGGTNACQLSALSPYPKARSFLSASTYECDAVSVDSENSKYKILSAVGLAVKEQLHAANTPTRFCDHCCSEFAILRLDRLQRDFVF